jgi:hypothetical protein
MKQGNQLPLARCPHCNIAKPRLARQWGPAPLHDHTGSNRRFWSTYSCDSCGSAVLVCSPADQTADITGFWPASSTVAEAVPPRAKEFLAQAMSSLHAPAGAVMLTASAVDAMLKDKGYKDGSLNARIDLAAKDHLITAEMAAWAHEVRLEANDQRHADESASLPSAADAEKALEFASALAQFLYVLPARVERGRKS